MSYVFHIVAYHDWLAMTAGQRAFQLASIAKRLKTLARDGVTFEAIEESVDGFLEQIRDELNRAR